MRVIPMMMALIATAALAAAPVYGADADDPGRALYLRYCGACHGPAGHGDGIAGTFMRPKPADLTQLSKDGKGDFPFMHVMETIDGRNTVRAHGDPQMPVWGEVFQEQATWDVSRRADVRGKLMVITDYLRSIQGK
jgi:mono/diheme cytochrome c family protein